MIAKLILALVMMSVGMLALKYFTHRNERKKVKVKTRRPNQNAGQKTEQDRVENLVWDEQTQSYRVKH